MFRSSRLPCFTQAALSLAVLGLLAGCGGRTETRPVSLADLSHRALTYALVDLDLLETQAAGSHRFTLTLAQEEESCTRLEEGVTATFNGQLMTLEPGGFPDTGSGEDACEETRAWIDFEPERWEAEPMEDVRVFLEGADGSRTVSLILAEAKAKRHFEFQGPGTGETLQRGQRYTYRWLPAEELPGPVAATLLSEEGRAPAPLRVDQQGGDVSLTLTETTLVGAHLLTLSASLPGEVLECEGVASCEGRILHTQEFAVTVTP